MTYNVFGGTLNLAQSIYNAAWSETRALNQFLNVLECFLLMICALYLTVIT